MELFGYPVMIAFLAVSACCFLVSVIFPKAALILNAIGVVLLTLFTINGFLLGFPYLEIVVSLLACALIFLISILIRRRRT